MELKDQVALVTGGASGIGAAIVRRLASDGAHLAIVDIASVTDDTLAALTASPAQRIKAWQCDVTKSHEVSTVCRAIQREHPKSGEKALWAIPISTVAFEGISEEDGRRLIDNIWTFAAKNDAGCTYVHNWAPGDLLIWDNLMLQHARLPFASNEPGTLRRTPIL